MRILQWGKKVILTRERREMCYEPVALWNYEKYTEK